MKKTCIALIAILCCCLMACKEKKEEAKTIELPIEFVDNFGPFDQVWFGIQPNTEADTASNNPWNKTFLKVEGIPQTWTEIQTGDININIYQMVYQSYHNGTITEEWYKEVQQSWNWTPDTLNLSKQPMKIKVGYAYGKDKGGNMQMIIDTNNNLDLSDDTIFSPILIDDFSKLNPDSLAQHPIRITYERLENNQIVEKQASLLIVYDTNYKILFGSLAQHAIARYEGHTISITSESNLGYTKDANITLSDGKEEKVKMMDRIYIGEYITIEDRIYQNKGVDLNRNVLILGTSNLPKEELHSNQVGFKAFPFEGVNFLTNDTIRLEDYKGKYLLIDFWATWCRPCINEMPELKKMYEEVDKSKIEFLGIVCNSRAKDLKKILDENEHIIWPQIFSDESSKINATYQVRGYPTTFLIDPQGVIIAKNLRGEELKKKIEGLN